VVPHAYPSVNTRTAVVTAGNAVSVVMTTTVVTVTPRVIHYTYDPLNRLTGAEYSTSERFEYAYDAVGNRTAMTGTTSLDETTVTTYTCDVANRLLSPCLPVTWSPTPGMNGGTSPATASYTYTYNAAARLVRAESVTSTLVYTYNLGTPARNCSRAPQRHPLHRHRRH